MTTDLDHLSAAYREQALWSDAERIDWIRADRWMRLPIADRALRQLEDLLCYLARPRMPCLLIYGQTGMGKTEIIRKFARDHPSSFNKGTGVTTMPVVVIQMPAEPIEEDFYNELLRALGVPGRVRTVPVRRARQRASCWATWEHECWCSTKSMRCWPAPTGSSGCFSTPSGF